MNDNFANFVFGLLMGCLIGLMAGWKIGYKQGHIECMKGEIHFKPVTQTVWVQTNGGTNDDKEK